MYRLLSILAVLVIISTTPFVASEVARGEYAVPNWIKNTAGWWASDQIPDSAFLQGIQFLIKEGIMIVEIPAEINSESTEEIPNWVKNTAGWWAEDKIHDVTFVGGIKYLIGKGIIVVEQEIEEVEEPVEEIVEIKDFYMEVNGSNCCFNWAYIGKEYRFQIETFDEYRGNYIDGVTISAKIISKDGELRHDFGEVTTDDGIYKNSIIIPSMDWYAGNILSVTGEYFGVEKTIEKEFEVFKNHGDTSGGSGANAGSCAHVSPVSIATEETNAQGIAFSKSGTKMFIMGNVGDDVNEYNLTGGAYCISTASFVDSFDLSNEEANPTGIAFGKSGMKMFISGNGGEDINEYTLTTAFDVSTASFVDSFSVANEEDNISGITFSKSGTKMFISGYGGDDINEYTLTTAFDVSTASFVDSFSVANEDTEPTEVTFNKSGDKMFVVGNTGNDINEYTLNTAWDVSTASFVDSFSLTNQEKSPRGIWFDSSGNTMFIVGGAGDDVNVYTLTTAFDLSTASFVS